MVRAVIAVDAMGGDNAPGEIVKGAIEAAQNRPECEIILVGRERDIQAELSGRVGSKRLKVVHAEEIVEMEDEPAKALRAKKNSSISVGCRMVGKGEADAFVSAGNSGAVMAGALIGIGRIKGIERPAIAVVIPSTKRSVLLLDAGANMDVKPRNLLEFASMGSAFVESAFGVERPTVGLITIGEEPGKGNALTKASFPLFEESGLNFYGNIEGLDVPEGTVDVAVCDGMVGNVILKTMEGTAKSVVTMLKQAIERSVASKLGGLMLMPAFKTLKKALDPEEHGGALLVGVRGVCVIAHGRSNAAAMKNAIFRAHNLVDAGVVGKLTRALGEEGDS